jgi:ppGpp synthetase/RelA/SpoT-type nucleotidyltranferase
MFERMRAASENVGTTLPTSQSNPSTPAQQPVSPERALEIEKRAQDLYRSMHGGLTGWGTDEAQLLAALKGLSPAETKLLKEVYARRFNTELEKDITSELSGAYLAQARAALQGDRAVEKAAALYRAMDGIGTDEDAIVATLSSLNAEEQAKVAQAYKQAYGVELDTALRSELSGDDLRRVTALREGKPLTAAAVELHQAMSGLGTDEAAINEVMKRHSPEQMQAVAREYQQLYGVTLQSSLKSELSGQELRESVALMHGDRTAAKVAQLRGAMDGMGTTEETIYTVLEGTTAEEREKLKTAFHAETGTSLEEALKSELSGTELERANALLAHGKLSDVEKLRFAVQGWGTDEATIKEVLRDRSKEEVELLKKEYEARYHESLESRLHDELGGSDEFRAIQALKGRPTTMDEALQNMQELDAFERSGFLSGVIGAFSQEDERIQQQLEAARSSIAAAKKDGVVTAEERASIEQTLRFAEGDIDVYVETRDAIADTGATVAAVVGSTAVVIGTGGLATPGAIAMAAAAGGASYAGTKYAVQGNSYDGEGLASDIGIGAIEGTVTALTAGGATVVKNAAQQGAQQAVATASKTAVRETLVESSGAIAQDSLRPDTWAGGAAAGVANLAVSAAGTAITSGLLHRAGELPPPSMRDEISVAKQANKVPAGQDALQGARHPLSPTIENPTLDSVVDQMLKDTTHPMDLTRNLANPKLSAKVSEKLQALASVQGLSDDEFKAVVEATREKIRRLFPQDDTPFNINPVTGQKLAVELRDSLMERNSVLFGIGESEWLTQAQQHQLEKHADHLKVHVLPQLRDTLDEITGILPEGHYAHVSARAKTADGLEDKVFRMQAGNGGKGARPNYRLADVPDAVGGRVVVETLEDVAAVTAEIERKFAGKIFEKDNFYLNPKKSEGPYRVITYTVECEGVPCEVQVMTLASNISSDIEHNTVYKHLIPLEERQRDEIMDWWRGVSAQELNTLGSYEVLQWNP